jgi:hypothetical protein
MATTKNAIDMRARISWMWVYVMLNMLFADILSFMSPGNLQQIMAGHADSITITPRFLLLVAVVTQIPIAMVVLTQVLPQRAARWACLVASVLTIVYVIGGGSGAPHYVFIAALETVGCLCIAWWAWKWRPSGERARARELAVE